ncbi:MAG: surface lipoprotein assembly modifier [Deltaproteobacteria bacterium]|jgi:tetratricopeptide (TPR) repeat protein|nr:surface lipoprotein assembly modifier [Deltaproteobacteria bacterium]
MRGRVSVCLLLLVFSSGAWGETPASRAEELESLSLSPLQIVRIARKLIEDGETGAARVLLSKAAFSSQELEIERLYLLGLLSEKEGDLDEAIEIFHRILDRHPALARVRLELALTYMAQGSWYRADYHMRLAGASEDLPEGVPENIKLLLYIIRQNKNWDVWFNFGLAPDNNVNSSQGGEECIATIFGVLCRQLPESEKAVGVNLSLGGNYEYKFDRDWGLKNDLMLFSNTYDESDYDDLYLAASTGPRYVYPRGDVWVAFTASRRYLGHKPFSYSTGVKIDASHDFTNRLSAGLSLKYSPTRYDDYGDILDGDTRGASARLTCMLGASTYAGLKAGIEKEYTRDKIYTNRRITLGVNFGAELPAGFRLYIEPSVLFTGYDRARWTVKDYDFKQIKEKSVTWRYLFSVSNNKIDFWGFTPQILYSYTRRNSNIWQREYAKHALEFSMQRLF